MEDKHSAINRAYRAGVAALALMGASAGLTATPAHAQSRPVDQDRISMNIENANIALQQRLISCEQRLYSAQSSTSQRSWRNLENVLEGNGRNRRNGISDMASDGARAQAVRYQFQACSHQARAQYNERIGGIYKSAGYDPTRFYQAAIQDYSLKAQFDYSAATALCRSQSHRATGNSRDVYDYLRNGSRQRSCELNADSRLRQEQFRIDSLSVRYGLSRGGY